MFSSFVWFKMSTRDGEENKTTASSDSELWEDAKSPPGSECQAEDQHEKKSAEGISGQSPLAESTPQKKSRGHHNEDLRAGGAEGKSPRSLATSVSTAGSRCVSRGFVELSKDPRDLRMYIRRLKGHNQDIQEDLEREKYRTREMKRVIDRYRQDNKWLKDTIDHMREQERMSDQLHSYSFDRPQRSQRKLAPQDPCYQEKLKNKNVVKDLKQELEHVKSSHNAEKERLEASYNTALQERNKRVEEMQGELDFVDMRLTELIENLSNVTTDTEKTNSNKSRKKQPAQMEDVLSSTTQQEFSSTLPKKVDHLSSCLATMREEMMQVRQQLSDRETELWSKARRIAEMEDDLKHAENSEALSKKEIGHFETSFNLLLEHLGISPSASSTVGQVEGSKQPEPKDNQEKDSPPSQVDPGESKADQTVNTQMDKALSQIQKMTQEKDEAHDQLRQKERKLAELEQQLQNQQEQIKAGRDMSEKIENLKTEVSEKHNLNQQREAEISNLLSNLKETEAAKKDLQKCFDDLREEHRQLSEEDKVRKEDCQTVVKELNDLREQLKTVRSESDSKLAEINTELEETRKRLQLKQKREQEQNKTYEQLKSDMKAREADMKQKLEEVEIEHLDWVQEAKAHADRQIQDARSALESFQKRITEDVSLSQMMNEILQLSKRTTLMKTDLEVHMANHQIQTEDLKGTHESMLVDMEDKITKLESYIKTRIDTDMVSETKNRHKQTLQYHVRQVEDYRQQVNELKLRDECKEKELKEMKHKLESDRKQEENLEETATQSLQRLDEQQCTLKRKETEWVETVEEVRSRFISKLHDIESNQRLRRDTTTNLLHEYDKLKAELQELSTRLQNTKKTLRETLEDKKQLQSSVYSKGRKIDELNESLSEKTANNANLQKQWKELETSLKTERSGRASLSERMTKMSQEHEKVVEEKDRKIRDLESCLKSAEEKIDKLEKELTEETKRFSSLQKKLSEKKKHMETISDHTTELKTAQNEVARLKAELEETKTQLSVKTLKIKNLMEFFDDFQEEAARDRVELREVLLRYMTKERTQEKAKEIAALVGFESEELETILGEH